MKLTAQQVFDATLVVAQIIRENRPMPQKGLYRLARLHAKLAPEFKPISERRDAMIEAYEHREEGADTFSVPLDKMPEFNAAWAEIAGDEIEVDVQPVPLDYLDGGGVGVITAAELVTLGDLVRE